MPTIDFNNIIKHPLIKATEYSEVHGGSFIPANTQSSELSSPSSDRPTPTSMSRQAEEPVVLKSCRHPADFRELLQAFSKLQDYPQAPNIVTLYGATREYPSATTSTKAVKDSNDNSPPNRFTRAGTLSIIATSIASLSLSNTSASTGADPMNTSTIPAVTQQEFASPRDWIVTKPSENGTLYEFLKSPQGMALDWMNRIRLIRGVANGLLHLHEHGLLHMHLHSDNVLVERGPVAVLTDFGQVSRSTRGPEPIADPIPAAGAAIDAKTQATSGTRWIHSGGVYEKGLIYTAPERLSNPKLNPCTAASDIYSLGVIMLEILTGHRSSASQFLTSSSSAEDQLRLSGGSAAVGKSSASLPIISTPHGTLTLPSAMASLIRKICSRDPAQRPGLLAIRSQLKEMANTSYDLHVREPINKSTTGIQLNAKKPLSVISVVTTPSVITESSPMTPEPSVIGARSLIEPSNPTNTLKKRTSILRKALDMSLNSPPASPKRKTIQIWEAAVKGDLKSINTLLSQGVSVNQRDPTTDHTPLIAAVADLENPNQTPNIAVLELLINRGAEINAFDHKTKQTILHHLCSRPNPSPVVLRFLLERGANPNAVSLARQTPLHYLAEKAKSSPLEPMRLLLDFGADLDAKGPVMWTALHLLCSNEKPFLDAIMLLLTREVDVNVRDSNQWTALHFVAHYNQDPTQALKILVDAGADVNALTKRKESVVQVLLKSKSIDRIAAIDFVSSTNVASGTNAATTILGQFGGRKKPSGPTGGSYAGGNHARISTVSENGEIDVSLGDPMADSSNAGNVLLSPEEEAKEESLKKLADLVRWLIVDCGVDLEQTLDYEDPYPPSHSKNQHVLYRAIRLGMRSIIAVLLETSLAMSEAHILDEALQLTEEMLSALNIGMIQAYHQNNGNESGTGSGVSRPLHRRDSSVSSSSSGSSNYSHTTAATSNIMTSGFSNIVTPRSLTVTTAAIPRIQEIELLLKVWRFGNQRQQLVESVKARLARLNRRGSLRNMRHGDDGSTVAGGSSPASSVSSEHERGERERGPVYRSTTL